MRQVIKKSSMNAVFRHLMSMCVCVCCWPMTCLHNEFCLSYICVIPMLSVGDWLRGGFSSPNCLQFSQFLMNEINEYEHFQLDHRIV